MVPRPPLLRTVLLLGGSFLAAALATLFLVRLDRVVVAVGALEGSSRALRAPRSGLVLALLVEPGTRVEAGTPLVRLADEGLRSEGEALRARAAAIAARRASLAEEARVLAEQEHPASRAALEREVERARLVLDSARTMEQRYAELSAEGLVRGTEHEQAVLARQLGEVALTDAEAALAAAPARQALAVERLAGEARALEHEEGEVAARLSELARQEAESVVLAPSAGWLVGPRPSELAGRAVTQGEELARIALPGVERFVGHVDDRGRTRIALGLPAKLRLEGYPWLLNGSVPARLERINELADARGGGFRVELSVDESEAPGPLFDGLSGQARILTEERVSLLRLLFEQVAGLAPR